MMNSLDLLKQKRHEILAIAAKHGVSDVRVFGSAVHGEDRPDSDIDLLVKRDTQISWWFPAGFIADLERLLDRRVDVVTDTGLNPHVREYILHEAVPL
jgi:predicted nucleotidyltransferase